MGREGILPFSKLWVSNKPFNAPAAGLFEHWVVSVIIMLAPPPGDAYNFLVKYVPPPHKIDPSNKQQTNNNSLISYPLSIVNCFVSGGLIYIYLTQKTNFPDWAPGIRATLPVTIFFFLSNCYLVVAPYVPPTPDQNVYEELPYYLHCVVAVAIFALGALYWVGWAVVLPKLGGYLLVKETVVDADGWSRSVFTKLPLGSEREVGDQE